MTILRNLALQIHQSIFHVCSLPASLALTWLCFLHNQSTASSKDLTWLMDSCAISSKCFPHSRQPKNMPMYCLIVCSTANGSSSSAKRVKVTKQENLSRNITRAQVHINISSRSIHKKLTRFNLKKGNCSFTTHMLHLST